MKKKILAALLAAAMVLAVGCGPSDSSSKKDDTSSKAGDVTDSVVKTTAIKKEDLKVGFIYIGEINDQGYTQAHDKGRLALEADGIKTIYVENVVDNEDCENAIRNLVEDGCNVVYANSFGYMDYVLAVADSYPDVYFGHATGYKTADNVSTYMGKVYQARYLSGIAAGLKTKTNKIGYVAASPISEVVRGINAFTLGVQSVNPDATVEVIFTNTWFDPALEKQSAQTLLSKDCDVIAQHQDSTASQIAAEEAGAFAIGYNSASKDAAPKAYLTAPLFHWEVYYKADIANIIAGTRPSDNYWGGLDVGMVSLDALTENVADGTAEKIDDAKAKIISGDLNIFSGPIKNQKGEVKVAEGTSMTDDEIWNMDWFVEGVIGSLGN